MKFTPRDVPPRTAWSLEQAGVPGKENLATKDEIREIVREEIREALRNHSAPNE